MGRLALVLAVAGIAGPAQEPALPEPMQIHGGPAAARSCALAGVLCVGAGQRFATIQQAADAARPGDIVQVPDGVWAGFRVTGSGTERAPILFLATGEHVLVAGPAPGSVYHDAIEIEECGWVIVDGFIVRDAQRAGISVTEAHDVTVRNNIVGPNGRWGIFSGFSPGIVVENNKTFGAGREHGIYLSNSRIPHDRYVVRGNEAWGNHGNGIQLNGDCLTPGRYGQPDGKIEDAIVESNVVHDNQGKGLSIISAPGVIIGNNVIFHNGLTAAAGGIHLTNEPGCAMPSVDAVVVNNTVYEPSVPALHMTDDATGAVVFNNILISPAPLVNDTASAYIDARSNITSLSAEGLLVAADSGNCHLRAGSPARAVAVPVYMMRNAPDKDLEGNRRRFGGASAAGAYDYTGLPPLDTTPPPAPAGLRAASIRADRVELVWQPSIDPYSLTNQAAGLLGYAVYRGAERIGFTSLAQWADRHVTPGAGYSYTVVAIDAAANRSPASAELKVNTPAAAGHARTRRSR